MGVATSAIVPSGSPPRREMASRGDLGVGGRYGPGTPGLPMRATVNDQAPGRLAVRGLRNERGGDLITGQVAPPEQYRSDRRARFWLRRDPLGDLSVRRSQTNDQAVRVCRLRRGVAQARRTARTVWYRSAQRGIAAQRDRPEHPIRAAPCKSVRLVDADQIDIYGQS